MAICNCALEQEVKMNKYPSPIVIMLVCVAFFTAGILTPKVFSPPESGLAGALPVTPIRMTVYAYDAGACCCAPFADGLTASGVPAVGRICAAPPEYPFGTRLWIEGLGEYVVQDRGGDITGNRLDILFATHAEAKEWGVQYLMVKEVK